MKKLASSRITVIALILCLAVTCVLGGTLAKYISTGTGTDTATVAKWSFEVEDTEIAVSPSPTVTFDLFNTINDTVGGAAETDVKANLIAPGTTGSFQIDLENKAEVNATYAIAFTETNASSIPIEYSLNGTDWGNVGSVAVGPTAIAMETGTGSVTVYWRWVFAGNDATDTALGYAGTAPSITVSATVTATQVD